MIIMDLNINIMIKIYIILYLIKTINQYPIIYLFLLIIGKIIILISINAKTNNINRF